MIPTTKVEEWVNATKTKLDPDVAKWLTTVFSAGKEKKLTVGGTVLFDYSRL